MLNDVGFNVAISMTDMATYLKGAQGPVEQRPAAELRPLVLRLPGRRRHHVSAAAIGEQLVALPEPGRWTPCSRKAASSLDDKVRLAAYEKAHHIVKDDVAILPLYQAAIIYGAAKGLQWTPTANESMFLNRMSWQD